MSDTLPYLSAIGSLQLIGLLAIVIYVLSFGFVQLGQMDGNGAKYTMFDVLAASKFNRSSHHAGW